MTTETKRYITATEVAKLLRGALKAEFPGIKFSVRSSYYSGGSSIDVSYSDGPVQSAVQTVCDRYRGADFDGMQDLKTHHSTLLTTADGMDEVYFGSDYIFAHRTTSPEFEKSLIPAWEKLYGQPYDPDKVYEERHLSRRGYACGGDWSEPGSVLLGRFARTMGGGGVGA